MRGARRGAAGLLALLVTTLGAVVTTAPGAEAASGGCTPGTGVTVVVDYGSLGRSTGTGCDPGGGGDTGDDVMRAAGFTFDYTRNGQPFVCSIKDLPNPDEACAQTPPADAYWGLFWNDGKGGGWNYSSQGLGSLRVPAGGSIGWRWQDGGGRDLPRTAPNPPAPASSPSKPPKNDGGKPHAASTPTPAPTPTTASPSATPSAGSSPKAAPAKAKPDAKAPDKKKPDKKPDKKPGKAQQAKTPSASPSATQSVDGGEQVTATQPTSATPSGDDGTDQVVLLAGVGAVLLLGAAAGVLAWRRRA